MTWKKISQYGGSFEDYDFDADPPGYRRNNKPHRDWLPVEGNSWVHRSGQWLISEHIPYDQVVYQISKIPEVHQKPVADAIKNFKPKHDEEDLWVPGYYRNYWIDEAVEKSFPKQFKTFEQARLHTLLNNRKRKVQKRHNSKKHSIFCSSETCAAVQKSHATDHKLCNGYNCETINDLHEGNNHTSCKGYWCDANSLIKKTHANGEHHIRYCNEQNCPDIAQSHATDHKLCGRDCDVLEQSHKDGSHTFCMQNERAGHCYEKADINYAHNLGKHDVKRCNPKSCPETKINHESGHHELCPGEAAFDSWNPLTTLLKGPGESGLTYHPAQSFCEMRTPTWAHSVGQHFVGICNINSCKDLSESHKSGKHDLCNDGRCWYRQREVTHQAGSHHSRFCKREEIPADTHSASFISQMHAIYPGGIPQNTLDRIGESYISIPPCEEMVQNHNKGDHKICDMTGGCNYTEEKERWNNLDKASE